MKDEQAKRVNYVEKDNSYVEVEIKMDELDKYAELSNDLVSLHEASSFTVKLGKETKDIYDGIVESHPKAVIKNMSGDLSLNKVKVSV